MRPRPFDDAVPGQGPSTVSRRRRGWRFGAAALVAAATALAAACTPPEGAPPPGPEELPDGYEQLDGNYGNGTSSNAFTLFHDTTRTGERLVVFVHGGAWTVGSKGLLPHSVRRLVQHGYAVASINYPLSGVQRHPEQVRHIKDALSWFRSNSAALGIGNGAPVLAGFSAGGHLAALAGATGGVAGFEPHGGAAEAVPGAVVVLGGPVDLPAFNTASLDPLVHGANAAALTDYLNGSCLVIPNNPGCNAPLAAASPVTYFDAGDPPIYAIYAVDDERIPTSQGDDLDTAALAAGIDVNVIVGLAGVRIAECTEYFNAAGCDANPWFHSAVPRMLNTANLAVWLNARGLGA